MAEDWTLENVLGSKLDVKAARFSANREALRVLMAALRVEEDEIRLGGGVKAAEAQRAKGRLTVRERLKLLLDEGDEFLELGLWAAYGMYGEYGGAPAAGVVTGLGRVSGRLCMIIANDATVKAGGVFPYDGEEGAAGADHCTGEPDSDVVPGGLGGGVSAAAGGCVSGYG